MGAVLAAIVGKKPAPPPRLISPTSTTVSPARVEPASPPPSPSAREPEWIKHYEEARRTHADRAWDLFTWGETEVAPDTVVELPEFGWCEDEDGVRAVRPYLVAHEQRQRAERRQAVSRDSFQRASAPRACDQGTDSGTPGEWDELAGLIRQWHTQRTPVA